MVHLKRITEKGFGLLETAIAMVVIASIAAGSLMFYASTNTERQVEELYEQVVDLKRGIRNIYASRPNFSGISNDVLAASGLLSDKDKRDATYYSHAAKGVLLVEPAGAGFYVKMFHLRDEVCKKLVHRDFGKDVLHFWIGTDYHYPPFDKAKRDAMAASCVNDTNGWKARFRVAFGK